MATLKTHGEIGQIEYLTYKVAYCHDGKILRNQGNGWKLWKKLIAPDITPIEYYQKRLKKNQDRLACSPFYVDFKRLFHATVSFSDRCRVMAGLELLADDVDGLWSELNDFRDSYDLEELSKLAQYYRFYIAEWNEKKKEYEAKKLATV